MIMEQEQTDIVDTPASIAEPNVFAAWCLLIYGYVGKEVARHTADHADEEREQ